MARQSLATSLALSFMLLALVAPPTAAASEKVLYRFKSSDYGFPFGRLVFQGNALLGTGEGNAGYGQVFALTNSGGAWKESSLFKFDYSDGANPAAGLKADSQGSLYGTSSTGDSYGVGNVFVVYKLNGSWVHGIVYTFSGDPDGAGPTSDLVIDSSGNIYGTTEQGGTHGEGTIFELSYNGFSWTESVLYNFTGGGDGANPYAGLVKDSSGILYGTTSYGAHRGCYDNLGCGTVFELSPSGGSWTFTTLYSFKGGNDGGNPGGTLILGSSGGLHGTTVNYGGYGYGTVFNLTESGGKWTEKVLWNFDVADGAYPIGGPHWGTTKSTIYGTTREGGTYGYGTVYELTVSGEVWKEKVLHSFAFGSDGANPNGAINLDSSGNLYGTTVFGGDDTCDAGNGCGLVWEITP